MRSQSQGRGEERRTSLKEIQNLSSEVHNSQEGIVFISLSHYQMHKLVHDQDSFVHKVKNINNQAKRNIDLGAFKEALTLLSQAEKILEYAAGSGKTIQRQLIICVLHNIASVYHKLWILEKCLSYVEGIIFNLQNNLASLQNSVVSSNEKQYVMVSMQSLQMKHMLTAYSIRFCALKSQQSNHKQALMSAKKAIANITSIITFDQDHIRSQFKRDKQPSHKIQIKYRLLLQIIEFQGGMNLRKHKEILKATHYCLQIWNKSKQNNNTYYYLKNYSIGDFMEIKAKEHKSKGDKLTSQQLREKQFQQSIVYKLLLLSISYFSISTEMRLNVSDTQYYSQIDKQNGFHYRQAEIYHLLAIIIVSAFFEFEILYLKHLINSYTNYFSSDLIDYKTVESQNLEKVIQLINDKKSTIPGSTEIITSEQLLPESEHNQYKLKDKLLQKPKGERKNFHKLKKKVEAGEAGRSKAKEFSSLGNKSVIKQDKPKTKEAKIDSRQKTKSKTKPKSKHLSKKSKDKELNTYFVKGTKSKSKKKLGYEEPYKILKKVSPQKPKQHFKSRQIGSQILSKHQRRSILNAKNSVPKKVLSGNRSPAKKMNNYGFYY